MVLHITLTVLVVIGCLISGKVAKPMSSYDSAAATVATAGTSTTELSADILGNKLSATTTQMEAGFANVASIAGKPGAIVNGGGPVASVGKRPDGYLITDVASIGMGALTDIGGRFKRSIFG